jgi:hypothetical protein
MASDMNTHSFISLMNGPSSNSGTISDNITVSGFGRTDHSSYPPSISSRSYHDARTTLMTPQPSIQDLTIQNQQLTHKVMTLENQTEQYLGTLFKKIDDLEAAVTLRIAQLEAKLVAAEATLTQTQDQSNQQNVAAPAKRTKPPKEVQSVIKEVVQKQAKALIGISEVRLPNTTAGNFMSLLLPEPYTSPGFVARTSDGHELFNPDWTQNKKNAYNRRYIDAVLQSALNQARVSDSYLSFQSPY